MSTTANLSCCLCGGVTEQIHYPLFATKSHTSNIPLIDLIPSCSKFLEDSKSILCQTCLDLLNEIDELNARVKCIQSKFQVYLENETLQKTDIKVEVCDLEKFDADTVDLDGVDAAVDSGKSENFVCHCSKVFSCERDFKAHLKLHDSKKLFVCEICGQSFRHKNFLNVHIDIHNGKSPYTCQYCKKIFTQKAGLIRHLPKHTGEMPFQCDQCGKRFLHHSSFNLHKLSHLGKKDFKCSECKLEFNNPSHLKRHMKTHTGEKKFECQMCGKKFAERYNLSAHIKIHGTPKMVRNKFWCQICEKPFDRNGKLEEHIINVHAKTPVEDLATFLL